MKWIVPLILFAAAWVPAFSQAGNGPALANQQLADPRAEARATALMEELRCIQCQGQSIGDSDAPIAAAMRHEVRTRVAAGESNAQIKGWLVSRYGEWIDFAPPSHGMGILLWMLPLLLLGLAIWVARGRIGKGA